MAKSAYIHIPFCAYKCDFCDFAAFAGVDELAPEYCRVVKSEIEQRLSKQPNDEKLESLFYGGGTPGYIDPNHLALVHNCLGEQVGCMQTAEITLETTPHSITAEKAKRWLEMGINRLSIGVQSFMDSELQSAGRDHTSQQALKGIEQARVAGFRNIGIDLIYGLPEQTLATWQKSLSTALSLGLPHLSAYGLTLSGNSPLLLRFPRESQAYPCEESFVEMYGTLVENCEQSGLKQYEISNFCRDGHQSQHNLTYWRNQEYLAFGVSAHRYVNGVRSSNLRSLKGYMRQCLTDETTEAINPQTRRKEAIMLGLRMRCGLNLQEFKREYGDDLAQTVLLRAPQLFEHGLLLIEDDFLRLSQKGVLISNSVLAELI